jgi:hypothetical protein
MAAFGKYALGPRMLPWLVFVVMLLSAALAFAASADKILGAPDEPATTEVQQPCRDMGQVAGPNVLAAMTTQELDTLQATLCPVP